MKHFIYIFIFACVCSLNAQIHSPRAFITEDPETSVHLGWNQVSEIPAIVYFSLQDFGTNLEKYNHQIKAVQDTAGKFHLGNCKIKGLLPNTTYYFVIEQGGSKSSVYKFKTLSANADEPVQFVMGANSSLSGGKRIEANKAALSLSPDFVFFAGNFTKTGDAEDWNLWFQEWAASYTDNQLIPLLIGKADQDKSPYWSVYFPHIQKAYNKHIFSSALLAIYPLNTVDEDFESQKIWLEKNHQKNAQWKILSYNQAIVSHVKGQKGNNELKKLGPELFEKLQIPFVFETGEPLFKMTKPLKPYTKRGSEEGFTENANGTSFIGGGCWSCIPEQDTDEKKWTLELIKKPHFSWVQASKTELKFVLYEAQMTFDTLEKKNKPKVIYISNSKSIVFKKYAQNFKPNPYPYPSKIIGAEAEINNEGQIDLTWKSWAESKDMKFIIQKSNNKTQWYQLVKAEGIGFNKKDTTHYVLTDPLKSNQVKVYYRIVMVDDQNMERDIKEVELRKVSNTEPMEQILQYRRNTLISIDLDIPQKGNYKLDILNEAGQSVFEQNYLLQAGKQSLKLIPDNLVNGNYLLELNMGIFNLRKNIKIQD